MAKQAASPKYIFKLHSSRLREAKWRLTLSISEARKNDEVISLADSQLLRWLDELNGVADTESQVSEIRKKIRHARNEQSSIESKRHLKQLYSALDKVQFKPDYLCVIIDRKQDYLRACRGFSINGIGYKRLLGTNGGVKNKTIVFVSERHADEINRRINNGRNLSKELVPAKLEAYKALTCSASIPVSMPKGILVVSDCETEFESDIIYLSDEADGEPVMEEIKQAKVQLNESDGYGLILPSLAKRWSEELNLDYVVSGVNTRFAWEKGMVFAFDFLDFADKIAGSYIVEDAWGDSVDVRDIELIFTTSMLKLWDSYDSCGDYMRHCKENGYTFGVAKTCPKELETERTLNYQFIQSYDLDDDDIEQLIRPTLDLITDILYADPIKAALFLKGAGLNDDNIEEISNDYIKAMMIEPKILDDPYVQTCVYQAIEKRINKAKVGGVIVHGNYSIACGDPYSLCQHIFGLEVTGLLKVGEIYNKYWCDLNTERLACFRAPMTCHNNIRLMRPHHSSTADYWYQHMTSCTLFNSWDTAAHALNGMDKDGDLVMLTDNPVLVNRLKELPALMCVQRQADKRIVSESDLIQSNLDSFGDDIGKITNRITAMYDVRAQFQKESQEYKTLDYRIRCGQLFQQNAIDAAKGIIAKPMPKEWHDFRTTDAIEDPSQRLFYQEILAEKKPYFMRYIYPSLKKQYNAYIKNANKTSIREFKISLDELLLMPPEELTDEQMELLQYYHTFMPVGNDECVMNRVCRRFEKAFDGYLGRHNKESDFDYTIMKSEAKYTKVQYRAILKLYEEYNKWLHSYVVHMNCERVDKDEALAKILQARYEFLCKCTYICQNRFSLCNIVLDICYTKSATKRFAWEMCGEEIIQNLLDKNNHIITYPVLNPDGEITFNGKKFSLKRKEIGGEYEFIAG